MFLPLHSSPIVQQNLSLLFSTAREKITSAGPKVGDSQMTEIFTACKSTAAYLPGSHSTSHAEHHKSILEMVWRASTSLLDDSEPEQLLQQSSIHIADQSNAQKAFNIADQSNAQKAFNWLLKSSHLQQHSLGLSEIRIAVLQLPEIGHYPNGLISPDSSTGFTLLHCCCFGLIPTNTDPGGFGNLDKRTSSVRLLKFLLEDAHCDPWSVDVLGRTPLHIASHRNWAAGIQILQEAMESVEYESSLRRPHPSGKHAPQDLRGWSPLCYTNLYSKQGKKSLLQRKIGTPIMDARILLDETHHTPDSTSMSSPHTSRLTPSDWIQRPTATKLSQKFVSSGGKPKNLLFSDRKSQSTKLRQRNNLNLNLNLNNLHLNLNNYSTSETKTPPPRKKVREEQPFVVSAHHGTRMGGRERFEDAVVCDTELCTGVKLYCIFDGHNGDWTSNCCAEWVVDIFSELSIGSIVLNSDADSDLNMIAERLTEACVKLDDKVRGMVPPWDQSGCVALIVLLTNKHIFTLNIGDCRAVLVDMNDTSCITTDLSNDFSAKRIYEESQLTSERIDPAVQEKCKLEIDRIGKGGGHLKPPYQDKDGHIFGPRVQGRGGVSIEPTRGFGDFLQKCKKGDDPRMVAGILTCIPEISIFPMHRKRNNKSCAIVIGCDGVWEQMNSEEVGKSVHASLRTELGAETACESLLTQCLEKVYSREKNVWEIGWLMDGCVDGDLDRNGTHVDVQMVEKIDTTPATYRETYVLHQIKTENVDRLPKSTDVKDESIDRRTMVKVRSDRKPGGCDNMSAIVIELHAACVEECEETKEQATITPSSVAGAAAAALKGSWFDVANSTTEFSFSAAAAAAAATDEKITNSAEDIDWDVADKSPKEQLLLEVLNVIKTRKSERNMRQYYEGKNSDAFLYDLAVFFADYDDTVDNSVIEEDTSEEEEPKKSKLMYVSYVILMMTFLLIGVIIGHAVASNEKMTANDWVEMMNGDTNFGICLVVGGLSCWYICIH
jgi:serine/threonine protein phosphatase PrpC